MSDATATARRNEWISPQNVIAVFGMAGMVWASYTSFRENSSSRVQALELRMSDAEKDLAAHRDTDAKMQDAAFDTRLRLDRLERK